MCRYSTTNDLMSKTEWNSLYNILTKLCLCSIFGKFSIFSKNRTKARRENRFVCWDEEDSYELELNWVVLSQYGKPSRDHPAVVAWIVRASITISVVVSGDRWIESRLGLYSMEQVNTLGCRAINYTGHLVPELSYIDGSQGVCS